MARVSKKQNKPESKEAIEHRTSVGKRYSLWVLLNQARDSMRRARDAELAEFGISTRQGAVLFIIMANGGVATPTEISKWLLKEPHTVSAILSRMEKNGLVNKIKSKGGRGRINVSLTETGKQAYLKTEKATSVSDILDCLSSEDQEYLSSILGRIRDTALNYTTRTKVPFP
ncbi:MarR family winged helix-turn-helix transcriptional regulator [Chloroflexota bacterium]